MAEWLTHLPVHQKVHARFDLPKSHKKKLKKKVMVRSPTAALCASVIEVAQKVTCILAHEVCHCLPPRLSDETINGGPKSMASVMPAR